MAVKMNKQARRLTGMALAISALTLPGVALAQQDESARAEWRAQREEARGHREDRPQQQQQQQVREAPAQRAEPQAQAQQANWNGGGRRDRGSDQVGNRGGSSDGDAAPQVAPQQQQQPGQQGGGWSGGSRQGRNWTDANRGAQQPAPAQVPTWNGGNRRDGEQHAGNQGRTWNRDGNNGGGRNWTDANRQNREGGDWRGRDDHQRHGDDRNRNGGYVSGGTYYGNNTGYNQNYRDRDRDNDHHQWNRQWRSNSSYNWYSYRSSHPSYFRLGTYYSPYRNYNYRRLNIGFFLDNLFFGQNYQIENPQYYRLPTVYGPYRWVRYYDDAVLVDIYSGEVVDVINDFFW